MEWAGSRPHLIPPAGEGRIGRLSRTMQHGRLDIRYLVEARLTSAVKSLARGCIIREACFVSSAPRSEPFRSCRRHICKHNFASRSRSLRPTAALKSGGYRCRADLRKDTR